MEIVRYRQEVKVLMRRSSFLIPLLLSIFVVISCGNTSKIPASPSSGTSGAVASTTQPVPNADVSVSDAGTPGTVTNETTTVTNQTTSSDAVDAPASTSEPDKVGVGDSEEDRQSDVDENGSTSTTRPTAPVTTHGIVTEEPADVSSGGVETWEPNA
jgi:hypothetical protein